MSVELHHTEAAVCQHAPQRCGNVKPVNSTQLKHVRRQKYVQNHDSPDSNHQ